MLDFHLSKLFMMHVECHGNGEQIELWSSRPNQYPAADAYYDQFKFQKCINEQKNSNQNEN